MLRREDKYKAKSFIDTFVYRTGDQVGAWSYTFLTWLGLGLTGISYVAAPLAALWCVLSIWLGRNRRRSRKRGRGTAVDSPRVLDALGSCSTSRHSFPMKLAALLSLVGFALPLTLSATPEDEQFESFAKAYIEQMLAHNPG